MFIVRIKIQLIKNNKTESSSENNFELKLFSVL